MVGLGRRQDGPRAPLQPRPGRRPPEPQRLRPPLRPPRTGVARRRAGGVGAERCRGAQGAPRHRRRRTRCRHARRPRRLPPAEHHPVQATRQRARRSRRASADDGGGLGQAGIRAPAGHGTEVGEGSGAAQPVRFADLEPGTDGARVRLRLPRGDLHPAAQARLRLLRAAVPARRRARRTHRPQGRSRRGASCASKRRIRSPASTTRRWRPTSPPSCGRWPTGWSSTGWRRPTAATWHRPFARPACHASTPPDGDDRWVRSAW